MANNIKDMAQFLPPRVRIAKTPEFRWQQTTDITMEVVELKTEDVIAAFLSMQQQAIQEAGKISDARHRNAVIRRIRAMTHFMPN